MDISLEKNERIDDLQCNDLKIIQNKDGFCFGIDSVLLSDFAKNIRNNSIVLDLGTGTGIIPILLCGKTKLKKIEKSVDKRLKTWYSIKVAAITADSEEPW